jgi:RNA polymerase sigma factor (sigma-70 family)
MAPAEYWVTARRAREKITHEQESRMRRTPSAVGDRLDDAALAPRSVREHDEAAVVARSLQDPDQFAAIYESHFAGVYRYVAGRLGRGVAEDLAAETFLIAFRKRDRFDPALGRVRPWLYGIATILVGQHRREETRRYRAMARAGRRVLDSEESHDDRVADAVTAERLGRQLAAALADLGHGDRDVLLLVAISELSHHEVGLALDIPTGTVGSRLNRARRVLREALGVIDPRLELEEGSNG